MPQAFGKGLILDPTTDFYDGGMIARVAKGGRCGTQSEQAKNVERVAAYERTAGPFDRLRAGSSTAPLAMRLREAALRMIFAR
jgi:hypothetical protein